MHIIYFFLHQFSFNMPPLGDRNEWIGPVTLRIFDAKKCKIYVQYKS